MGDKEYQHVLDVMEKGIRADEREKVIEEIYSDIDEMFYTTVTRNLNDLEYGHNQGLAEVQDYLEQLKSAK